jgi:hypothetical protein
MMAPDKRNIQKIQIISTARQGFAILSVTDDKGDIYELELGRQPSIKAYPNEENAQDIQVSLDTLVETIGKTKMPLPEWIEYLFFRKNGLTSPYFHLAGFGEGGTFTLYNPGTIPFEKQDETVPAQRDFSAPIPTEIERVFEKKHPSRYLAGHPRLCIAGMGLLVSDSYIEKGPDEKPTVAGAVIYNPDKLITPDMSRKSIEEFVNSKRGVRITLNALSQVTADCRVVWRIPDNSEGQEFKKRIVKPMWGETRRISIDLFDHLALPQDFPRGPPNNVNYLTESRNKLDAAGIEYTVLRP